MYVYFLELTTQNIMFSFYSMLVLRPNILFFVFLLDTLNIYLSHSMRKNIFRLQNKKEATVLYVVILGL
jgi:hypothetical protein